jgi:hypothetical protein
MHRTREQAKNLQICSIFQHKKSGAARDDRTAFSSQLFVREYRFCQAFAPVVST